MPTPGRNYVFTYIISQHPDHPAIFFGRAFSSQALMSGFRIRGVFGMEYPRVLGRAMAGARISVNIINNQMYILKITVVYYNHQVSIYDLT